MQVNEAMKKLLDEHGIEIESVPADNSFMIWHKRDRAGRTYYGVSHFWNLDRHGVSGEQDLAQLEFDANEIYLDAYTREEIPAILRKGIGVCKAWKTELERDHLGVPFTVMAYFSAGESLENDPPEEFYSLTLRFWAPQEREPIVNLRLFDEWEQPALLDHCNDSADRS